MPRYATAYIGNDLSGYMGYSSLMDLSALTDAELTTLKTNLLASLNRSTNAQSYEVGGRKLSRMDPKDTMDLLNAVSREIAARADSSGDPFILVEFGGPI